MIYYGCIYKITNKIDGKIYIGQTLNKDPWKRIKKHLIIRKIRPSYISKAINHHGKENFTFEIICSAFDQSGLNDLEQHFISYYNSLAPNGYNFASGGKAMGHLHEETKKKIGNKAKTYYNNHEHPFKGKKFSKDHLESLSKARKGFDSPRRKEARKKAIEKQMLKIKAINIKTKEEITFNSIAECARSLNLDQTCVSRASRGSSRNSQHKGWIFERADGQKSAPARKVKNYSRNGNYWNVYKGNRYLGSVKTEQEAIQKAKEVQDGKEPEFRKKKKVVRNLCSTQS